MARLLFDQNLSHRLVSALADLFPDSLHLRDVGLSRAGDFEVWDYARDNGFVLVTKDSDFNDMSFLYGAPPKVVVLRTGNCSTDVVLALVRKRADAILSFVTDQTESLLVIDVVS